jgi:hypothetical protein
MDIVKLEKIEDKILIIREEIVLLDSDVAEVYGVATKEVNQAVSNNPDKFPGGYIIELTESEKMEVVKKFDHLNKLKFSPYLPKAFTEKALYMLATILKGEKATQTTLAIIELLRETVKMMTQNLKKKKLSSQSTFVRETIQSSLLEGIIDIPRNLKNRLKVKL